jgi:hypothetical protein
MHPCASNMDGSLCPVVLRDALMCHRSMLVAPGAAFLHLHASCRPVPRPTGMPAACHDTAAHNALAAPAAPPTFVRHPHDLHHPVQQTVHHLKARVLGAEHRYQVPLILGTCFLLLAQQHHVRDLQAAGPRAAATVSTACSLQGTYGLQNPMGPAAAVICTRRWCAWSSSTAAGRQAGAQPAAAAACTHLEQPDGQGRVLVGCYRLER